MGNKFSIASGCYNMTTMTKTLSQHLDPSQGPKRILALDGGGIRGALSVEYPKLPLYRH
jgi:hypothetical protein